jgi:enamine deaminase RidA (YjgF/YER057c/UK114 family)
MLPQSLSSPSELTTPLCENGKVLGHFWDDDFGRWCELVRLTDEGHASSRGEQVSVLFRDICRLLAHAELGFEHVVRTWFFLDHILDWYGEFNQVRTRFLAERSLLGRAPASTAVGQSQLPGIAAVASVLAVRPHEQRLVVAFPPSPLQSSALDYGSSFSRAASISWPKGKRLFISGTASIAPDGQSTHLGDFSGQVESTMDVVAALLLEQGLGFEQVVNATAYIRPPALEAVGCPSTLELSAEQRSRFACAKESWERRGGGHLFHEPAQVCRDELLFELELEAMADVP